MTDLGNFLQDRRKAELQTMHQFWFPGESRLSVRSDLEERIADALVGGVNVAECVARLTRSQRALLKAVLAHSEALVECEAVHAVLEADGLPTPEVENAGRMLFERGFLGRVRKTSPRREYYRVTEHLAENLTRVFDLSRRRVEPGDQLSQKRLPFEIDFDGEELDARVARIADERLQQLVRIAIESHGLVDANTPGVLEAIGDDPRPESAGPPRRRASSASSRSKSASASAFKDTGRKDRGIFSSTWPPMLEESGVGTIGPVSLKDFGIVIEEPALIIFQEWIQRRARTLLRQPVHPDTAVETGVDLYIDLERLIGVLEENPIQLTRDGKVPRRAYEALRTEMYLSRLQEYVQEDVAEALVALAQRIGVVERYAGLLQLHEERLMVWRKLDLTRQVELILEQFLEEKRGARWSFHQETLRRILIEVLREQVHDEWVPLEALVSVVVSTYLLELEEREVRQALRQRREEDFARERLNSPFHRLGRDLVYWIVNRLLVLGVCELGSVDGKLTGFRLSSLGKEVLGVEREPRESRILVNPDGEIILFCEGLRGLRLELVLSRFASRISAERVRRYRIDRDSIRAGIRSGLSLSQIRKTLQKATDHPLPEPVLVALKDWGKDLDWVQVEPTVCLSGLTGAREGELSKFLDEHKCGHTTCADGTVVIRAKELHSGRWSKTLEALREAGWLIRSSGGAKASDAVEGGSGEVSEKKAARRKKSKSQSREAGRDDG